MRERTWYRGSRIAEPPTWSGRAGKAWRLRLPPTGARATPDMDGTVASFIAQVPGAHPLWDHWIISILHLRPIAGVDPARKTFPEATHELMIASLDPRHPLPSLNVDRNWQAPYLTPLDVEEQFVAANDAIADQILEIVVRAIVLGFASPDQDWREVWAGAIAATADHYSDGTHAVSLN